MNAPADKAIGRCACGSIKYLITLPAKFCVHCHCPNCRSVHGSAFITWFGVPIQNFKVGGQEHLKWYYPNEKTKRGFCINCGTPLFYISARFPGDVHITLGSVINKVDIAPKYHIYYDRRVPWLEGAEALPCLGGPNGTDPLAP